MKCLDEKKGRKGNAIKLCQCTECCRKRKRDNIRRSKPEIRKKINADSRAWRAANPEKKREDNLKKRYGITIAQFEELLLSQKSKCAICGTSQSIRRLDTDHNHKTDKIRGILCNRCNRGIGFFDESIELLNAAVCYLEKHENKETVNG